MIIEVDDKLISQEIFDQKFNCDLNACKGACCVKGDAGAPLTWKEVDSINNYLDKIKPFMRPEMASLIDKNGFYYTMGDNEPLASLNNGEECVFAIYDSNNTAKCSIESTYRSKEIDFIKPLSCHLYPIRVKKFNDITALNYEEWHICKPACECGLKNNVKVYEFLKEPLIRAFGSEFYEDLTQIDIELKKPQ